MAIKRVWIEEGCILCHSSVGLCPDVFGVDEDQRTAVVQEQVDYGPYEDEIYMAAANCPVQVIRIEESSTTQPSEPAQKAEL